MTDQTNPLDQFLAKPQWAHYERKPLAGDASSRRYERLVGPDGQSVIAMDAGSDESASTTAFACIAEYLCSLDLAAPAIFDHDAPNGIMVISDLGTDDFAKWLLHRPDETGMLYSAATEVLLRLNGQQPDLGLKRMTPDVGAEMIQLAPLWYAGTNDTSLSIVMRDALSEFAPCPDTIALRDFHAENLIWRCNEKGTARVGLLDFQDAFMAPAGYDLVSLLRDIRRDVEQDICEKMIDYFKQKTGLGPMFDAQLACLGTQRNLRILGVFARLARDQGKTRYLEFLPRVWSNILLDLRHPALGRLREATLDVLPEPTPDVIDGLKTA